MRHFLLPLLQDRLRYIADSVYLRPVNLRLGLSFVANRRAYAPSLQDMRAHTLGFVGLNRAGVGLFLRNPDFRQCIKNGLALDFQLTR